jgi:hypothetical protein
VVKALSLEFDLDDLYGIDPEEPDEPPPKTPSDWHGSHSAVSQAR